MKTFKERRATITRLRGQLEELIESVWMLYIAAEDGSREDLALEEAHRLLVNAKTSLGHARDAITAEEASS